MKIKVGKQDENFTVIKVDTSSNQAWLQFGRSKASKDTWNNISNVCNDFVSSLDTGVAKELLDIGYGKAFVLSKDEAVETGRHNMLITGIIPMGNAWTRTESTSKEAYYVGTVDKTIKVGAKTEEHLIMPTIILPASLEVFLHEKYYYLSCQTGVSGDEIISIQKPTANGTSITYNGSPQKPKLTYDEKNVTVILPSDYTDVGSYTGYFRLKDKSKTQWSGGGTEDIPFIWEITSCPISSENISQKGMLTYNGSRQTPKWNNYGSGKIKIGGTTGATNAGVYTASFTPKPNYTWSDGTTQTLEITWIIEKKHLKTPTLSFYNTTYNGEPHEPDIDYHGNKKLIETTRNYTPYPTDSGYYTITFKVKDPDNYGLID